MDTTVKSGDSNRDILQDRAIRLFSFLRELAKLRTKVVRDLDQYEQVVWFGDIPEYKGCFSVLTPETDRLQDTMWLHIKKTPEPKRPLVPPTCLKWLGEIDEDDPTDEPQLIDEIPVNTDSATYYQPNQYSQEQTSIPEMEKLSDHPEILREWKRWKQDDWLPWVETYRQWKQADDIYFKLFSIHQQLKKLGERYEVILGLGLLTWETPNNQVINRHIIVGNANLNFDADRAKFELQAAAEGVKLQFETEMIDQSYLPSLEQLKDLESMLGQVQESPWEKDEIDRILRSFINSISPYGSYSDSSHPPDKPAKEPTVTFAPAIILRQRRQRSQIQSLSHIIEQISDGGDVPSGIEILCEEPGQIEDSDESNGTTNTQFAGDNLYLPLPTNDEQKQIISRIASQHGILVQGPPGTGKSHTIANIICHLLAQGKRVLVTSQTPRALKVLKEKIPEEIRTLCVTLLGNDQVARQELQDSVSGINQRHSDWDQLRSKRRIIELDEYLYKIKKDKANKERLLRERREIDTYQHEVAGGGYRGTAQQIAQRVAGEESTFAWLEDSISDEETCPLSNAEFGELLRLYRELTEDFCTELEKELVSRDSLPDVAHFIRIVDDEAKAKQDMAACESRRGSLRYHTLQEMPENEVKALRKSLSDLVAAIGSIRSRFTWIQEAVHDILVGNDTPWKGLHAFMVGHLSGLEERSTMAQTLDVQFPEYVDSRKLQADAVDLRNHLETGGKMGWKFLAPRVVRQNRYITNEVKVNGRFCRTSEQLDPLITYLEAVDEIELLWSAFQGKDKREEGSLLLQVGYLKERLEALEEVLSLEDYLGTAEECLKAISGLAKPQWDKAEELEEMLSDIQAVESEYTFKKVTSILEETIQNVHIVQSSPRSHSLNQEILAALEGRNAQALAKCLEKLESLEKGQAALHRRETLHERLNRAAPGLARQLQNTFMNNIWDERAATFEAAWAWKVTDKWLRRFGEEHDEAMLESSLRKLIEEEQRTTSSLAAAKAWDNCLRKLTPFQRANLIAWATAMRRMPKTLTAKTRPKWLREAQKSMDNCRGAIPAWIMPLYRVFETISPAPECFDVVIIDEASQTGPEGLVLQYLAKQCIIVGDAQQIAPEAIGVLQDEVDTLVKRHLEGIPFKGFYDPQSSLFAFAEILFRSKIVLREHFRCMPEIIQFSNQLCYTGTPLKPLRQYPPKRLEPILVHHVKDGFREGSSGNVLNRPEADALVETLVDMCSSKEYAGKTMGVISLQGEAQAKYIESKLLTRLSPTDIETREIVCGDAYAFQGDERDIMLLSMVAAPNERIGTLNRESDKRRFNVAASRAKDQAVLFYTATLNELHPECMRHKLLEYYLNPTRQIYEVDLSKCESQFERDVCQALIDKGYKVIPQYKVAEYRIDLVVEGTKSRLAVECDGDEWHGIEQYESDVARQRILERCGWRFWRIRGHEYYRNHIEALDPLWRLLSEMGIRPASISGLENEVSSEDKEYEQEESPEYHPIISYETESEPKTTIKEESESKLVVDNIPSKELVEEEVKGRQTSGTLDKSEIYSYSPQFFFELAHQAKEMNKFQPWERSLIFKIGKYMSRDWKITEKMERQALRLIDEARLLGLIKNNQEKENQQVNELAKLPRDFLFRVKKLSKEGWSLADIATKFGVSAQSIQEAINQRQGEINTLIGEMFKDNDSEHQNTERLPEPSRQLLLEDLQLLGVYEKKSIETLTNALDTILSGLKERQALIVRLRFGLNDGRIHTLEEIGRSLDLSRERIRQIEEKALRKLKHPSKKQQLERLTGLSDTSVIDLLHILSPKGSMPD